MNRETRLKKIPKLRINRLESPRSENDRRKEDEEDVLEADQVEKKPEGHIIEQKVEEKSIDEVLEGI